MAAKNIFFAGLFMACQGMPVFAQGTPVIDITNIIAAIENGYTLASQLENMINQIQTAYTSLQHDIDSFKSFDFSKLDAADPMGSWRAITTYADRQASYIDNIEHTLNNKNIQIGGDTYSMKDIFGGKRTGGLIASGAQFVAVDPFTRKLSAEEKAAFYSKYGMNAYQYLRYSAIGEVISKKAGDVFGFLVQVEDGLDADRKRLQELVKRMSGEIREQGSIIAEQQQANTILLYTAHMTTTTADLLGKIGQLYSLAAEEKKALDEQVKGFMGNREIGFPGGLADMLDRTVNIRHEPKYKYTYKP